MHNIFSELLTLQIPRSPGTAWLKAIVVVFFCTISSIVLSQKAPFPKVRVKSFSIEQGLSDRVVNAIAKDNQGFLWIATDNGLNRFDGYEFLNYDTRPRSKHKIRYNKISALLKDRTGNLYIHYEKPFFEQPDLLNPLTGEVFNLTLGADKSAKDQYKAFFHAPDGAIYFLTASAGKGLVSVYLFDEQTHRPTKLFETIHAGVNPNCFFSFLKASDGTFWFAYNWPAGKELLVVHSDVNGQTIRAYSNKDFALPAGSILGMVSLTESAAGEIWFKLSGHDVFVTQPAQSGEFKRHSQLPRGGYDFVKDKKGNLLAYQSKPEDTAKGCYLITATGQVINYIWIFEHQAIIRGVYSPDFAQGLLIGTGNGFNNYQLYPDRFKTFLDKDLGNEPYGISIRGIAKSGKDKLFIATERDGLFELNTNTNIVTRTGDRLPHLAPLNTMQFSRNLLSQGDSVLWMPYNKGVLKYTHTRDAIEVYARGIDVLAGAAFGKKDNLWMIFRKGDMKYLDMASGQINAYLNKDGRSPLANSEPTFIMSGRDGTIWVGSALAGLIRVDVDKGESRRYTADPQDPSGFNSNHITCIHEDESGLLWVGTMEGGLHIFDPHEGRVTAIYSRNNGLLSNSTVGILPDDKGNYWVSTYNGLSYFDTKRKTFRNYTIADGLSHNEFNRLAFFFDKAQGRFYFGGMNGVNAFDENAPQSMANEAPLLISEVSITEHQGEVIVMNEGILDGSTLTLNPGSRLLKLKLALGDYFNSGDNQYSYSIEGLDKDWNYLGTNRELHLELLPAGDYNLRLRGTDNRGNWSSQGMVLHLVVRQFWYKRWWAFLMYAVAFFASIYYVYRFQLRKRMAAEETRRLQQLDAFKNRFFTNISHEFRTPLTVILGMVEPLKKRFDQNAKQDHDLAAEMIRRNSHQLLNLVNQLLDLSRLESGKLKLSPANGDMAAFLKYQAESFQSFAQTRHITLSFRSSLAHLKMAFDHDKVQTIVGNLISNALKFTPEGGRIVLELEQKNDSQIFITLSDTGIGIPEDQLPRIFDRFYQVDDSMTRKEEGTGIGLALVQELIKLMQGAIKVESVLQRGTIFRITLPYTPPVPELYPFAESSLSVENQAYIIEEDSTEDERPLLLIVEDNPDVRFYIAACVKDDYRIALAGNGAEGILKARELVPDIIISDVMMPEKDGFELCETLKSDEPTSHIPIVLLTARADFDSRIAGLKRGADDYLAKPFEPMELLIRLQNLVKLRRLLQQRYAALPVLSAASDDPALELEDAFLIKIREVVEARLSETDFDMLQLEQALGMSRSQVFRKVKALTGTSPSVLIRSIRLHKAKELLRDTPLTISEIAYEVGFSTPAYFSTTFSEEFGKTPTEWRQG